MQVKWKKLLAKTVIWLAAEILLNFLGVDDLADYSEFIFDRNVVVFLGWYFLNSKVTYKSEMHL